ncbi:MAG: hypothetical protein V4689_23135 [Verrucomicrobiota bacterium]
MKPIEVRPLFRPFISAWSIFLLAGNALGAGPPLPIISKVQVMYSMVGHHSHIADRVAFFNTNGSPLGNANYVVPHLVYEPLVTLYNPHNTTLTMAKSRVRISNPPVGFRFKKNGDYLRSEWAAGQFFGLGRFQIANENNSTATKTITMILGGGTSSSYSGQIVLQPGESKTFAARVETNWTWGLETVNGFSSRCFFDWDASSDFTNKDYRTSNLFGIECIPQLNFRAGFQTDALSVGSGRPAVTKYPFESSPAGSNWVAIKTTDTVTVEAKGVDTTAAIPSVPDFQLSLLKGIVTNPTADLSKKYDFSFANLVQPVTDVPATPAITRTYGVSSILQTSSDASAGGKSPFAVFTIVAKSEALQHGKFLSSPQPASSVLYETRLDSITYFTEGMTIGPSDRPAEGVAMTAMQRVGNSFIIDVAAEPGLSLKVKGSANLNGGFHDDLTSLSTIREGPENSGIYKVTVDVTGRGARYFVRIEK